MSSVPDITIKREKSFDQLGTLINTHKVESKTLALLFIEINHFRQFNIAHGYLNGDRLLQEFYRRLDALSREQDYIARIGNSEFILVLPEVFNEGHASLAAIKVLNSLNEAVDLDHLKINITATIGIALFPQHATDTQDLLKKAEIALTNARKSIQLYSIYSEKPNEVTTNTWDIESELQCAIDEGQFELYFQPQVYLKTGRVFGAEALIRWKNEQRGFIRPDIFIPIAEKSGHILDITIWTINAALWSVKHWPKTESHLKVAVNLSTKVLGETGLLESITNAINIHGLEFNQLTLEITESAMVENVSTSFAALDELKSLGLNISIDDFGTGYSSMAYFKNIPANELKIDQVFVRYMLENPMDKHIVKTLIKMAQGFNLEVVAEGIEDRQTFNSLKELGCDIAQGYYLAKPMPQSDFIDWLENYKG